MSGGEQELIIWLCWENTLKSHHLVDEMEVMNDTEMNAVGMLTDLLFWLIL